MSDRLEDHEVTDCIVKGFLRAMQSSLVDDIVTLCKEFIGYHFMRHKGQYKWIIYDSDYEKFITTPTDESMKFHESPVFEMVGTSWKMKVHGEQSSAIVADGEEFDAETHTNWNYNATVQLHLVKNDLNEQIYQFIAFQTIQCAENGFKYTQIRNHVNRPYSYDENEGYFASDIKQYKQLTVIVSVTVLELSSLHWNSGNSVLI